MTSVPPQPPDPAWPQSIKSYIAAMEKRDGEDIARLLRLMKVNAEDIRVTITVSARNLGDL